jgi:hypothetical protein
MRDRTRIRSAARWLMLALVLAAGCKKSGPPPLPLRVVELIVASGADPSLSAEPGIEAALQEEALAQAAQRGLQRAGVRYELSPATREPGDFTLRLEVLLSRAPAKTGVEVPPLRALSVGLLRARTGSVQLSDEAAKRPAPELSRLQHIVAAERPQKAAEGAAAWATLTQRAVEDTAAGLGDQLRILGQPSKSLIQIAADRQRDQGVRGIAIQLLGLRKEREALPALVAVIKEKDKEGAQPASPDAGEGAGSLRDHAIGALIEIGDQAAVRPLLDVVQLGDRVEVGKILEAVAALGGDEARRYLEFVSVSHSDERVRGEAKTALGRLKKREARDGGG